MSVLAIDRDEWSVAFFDAAAQGVLLIRRDGDRYEAPSAHGPGDWVPASGEGTIVSWIVIPSRDGSSVTGVIVELAEGPWMHGQLVGDHSAIRGGAAVRVEFEHPPGGEAIPVWRLSA